MKGHAQLFGEKVSLNLSTPSFAAAGAHSRRKTDKVEEVEDPPFDPLSHACAHTHARA
jgi:hypothetical protein